MPAALALRAAVALLQQHATVLEALPPAGRRRGAAGREHGAHLACCTGGCNPMPGALHGRLQPYAWRLHGRLQPYAWRVHGRLQPYVWRIAWEAATLRTRGASMACAQLSTASVGVGVGVRVGVGARFKLGLRLGLG